MFNISFVVKKSKINEPLKRVTLHVCHDSLPSKYSRLVQGFSIHLFNFVTATVSRNIASHQQGWLAILFLFQAAVYRSRYLKNIFALCSVNFFKNSYLCD